MGFFDRLRGIFNTQPEVKEISVEKKTIEDIGAVLAPVFREIPPDSKAGKFLREGARSWAYIAMSAIADEVCTTELELFKRTAGDDWLEVENNQILDVLNKPNQVQTKEELLWLITLFLLAEGEAPLMVDNAKNPTQMVLLNPENIKINYEKGNIIGSYTYRQSNGQMKVISKDEIVFLRFPNFLTPFRGMGVMKFISQTLDIDNYIEEYLRMFFFNDATPGSVLETDKELTKQVIDRLKSQLREKHQGYKKAHKNIILELGLKWVSVQSKLSELQYKELQDGVRDKILAAFKVPKSILGITEDVNRANGENSDRVFAKRCILPKLKMIGSQLNQFFIPKYSEGGNLWLEFQNPVKEDQKLQAEVDQIYITAGVLTANEIRARMELPPIEGGDKTGPQRAEEQFNRTADQADKDKDKEPGKKHPNPHMINKIKGIAKKEVKEIKSTDAFVELMKDFLRTKEKKANFSQEELIKYHNDKIAFTDKIEEGYKEKLKWFFGRQSREVLRQVKGYKKKAVELKLDEEQEAKLMAEISIPFIEEVILKESELAYAILGLSGHVISPQDEVARKFIERRTLKLGKSTAGTSKDDIQSILHNWAEDEGSIADLRAMLKDYFEGAETNRVDMIARTEISRASGFAQETVYKETGAVGKQWITAQDEKVCEFCGEMDGKVVGISDNYWEKGETMLGGRGGELDLSFESISTPPLHPDCRCDLIPVYEESRISREYQVKNKEKFEQVKALREKEANLNKKEIGLIEKEQDIAKKEAEVEKTIQELENIKQ